MHLLLLLLLDVIFSESGCPFDDFVKYRAGLTECLTDAYDDEVSLSPRQCHIEPAGIRNKRAGLVDRCCENNDLLLLALE